MNYHEYPSVSALSHPAPVQAEQSLEVVAWHSPNFERLERARPDDAYGSHTIPLTDHAKATAALAQKDAEIALLVAERDLAWAMCDQLRAQLQEAENDARNWRQYQARKQAIIAAGMGKNPLRDAAISTAKQEEV